MIKKQSPRKESLSSVPFKPPPERATQGCCQWQGYSEGERHRVTFSEFTLKS